jgi:hypothetical protein
VLASGTQDRGFAPDRSRRIFPAGKIHRMPIFRRGSKITCPMLVTHTTKRSKRSKGQLWYNKKKPGGGEIFRTRPDRTWGPPILPYNGYRVFFRGIMRPGRDVYHTPPSSGEVTKGFFHTFIHPMGLFRPVMG